MIEAPIEGIRWSADRIIGEHRHFRMNATCPACWRKWSEDFTDREAPAWLDPVRLGLHLLCGVCSAKRRLIYVERSGNRVLWSAPYFRPEDERRAWAVLRDPANAQTLAQVVDLGPWVEHELPHLRAKDSRLRDDKADVARPITRQFRSGAWEVDAMAAETLGWKRPPPPDGFRAAPAIVDTSKGGLDGRRYD